MDPRYVDVTKVRDAMQAGATPEDLARSGMNFQGGTGVGSGSTRQTGLGRDEVAFAQEAESINHVLRAQDPSVKPAVWLMSISRLDVVENNIWTPITHWLDPRLLLTMPQAAWDRTVRTWAKQGWSFRDDATMVPTWRAQIMSRLPAGEIPVPYCHVLPAEKVVETYGFCTDVREPRLQDWKHADLQRARDRFGCTRVVHGIKSGRNENWPSQYVMPAGVHTLERGVWQAPRPHDASNGGTITAFHYAPGEHIEAQMVFLKRILDDGFEVQLNEAFSHLGVRWSWADAHPEVALHPNLIGEGVYRMPFTPAA